MVRILVAEDDNNLNVLFSKALSLEGYEIYSVFNGQEALDYLEKKNADLLVTDVMMPKINGLELVRELREAGFLLPILMITVKEDFENKRKGFMNGVDDYMVKPVDVDEMVLRVKALLRRANVSKENILKIGNTIIDATNMIVSYKGETIHLRQKEFEILFKLASYPNKTFTRTKLMEALWDYDTDSEERTIDVHIKRLRDSLQHDNDLTIETVRGLGYKVVLKG